MRVCLSLCCPSHLRGVTAELHGRAQAPLFFPFWYIFIPLVRGYVPTTRHYHYHRRSPPSSLMHRHTTVHLAHCFDICLEIALTPRESGSATDTLHARKLKQDRERGRETSNMKGLMPSQVEYRRTETTRWPRCIHQRERVYAPSTSSRAGCLGVLKP